MRRIASALVLVVAAFVTAATLTANSEAPVADKLSLARRYAQLNDAPGLLESRFRSFADEMLAGAPDFMTLCGDYPNPGECRRAGAALMVDMNQMLDAAVANVGDYRKVLQEAEAAIFADVYTVEELTAAIAFAESPAGRSMNAKSPATAKRLSDSEYVLLRPWMEDLQKRTQEVYEKYGYVDEAPADAI